MKKLMLSLLIGACFLGSHVLAEFAVSLFREHGAGLWLAVVRVWSSHGTDALALCLLSYVLLVIGGALWMHEQYEFFRRQA